MARSWARVATRANKLLCFGGVLACQAFDRLGGCASVLRSDVAKLVGLAAGNLACLIEEVVDGFLVGNIHKGCKENDRCTDQTHAPKGDDLDEKVGEPS